MSQEHQLLLVAKRDFGNYFNFRRSSPPSSSRALALSGETLFHFQSINASEILKGIKTSAPPRQKFFLPPPFFFQFPVLLFCLWSDERMERLIFKRPPPVFNTIAVLGDDGAIYIFLIWNLDLLTSARRERITTLSDWLFRWSRELWTEINLVNLFVKGGNKIGTTPVRFIKYSQFKHYH